MKKNIFALVLLLSVVSVSYAQLNLGVKAGFTSSISFENLGSVSTSNYNLNTVQSEMWNNFHGGFFARIGLGKLYVQPELLYAIGKKNYKLQLKDALPGALTADKFVTISTVDVPLLLGYKLLDLKVVNLRVFAGPKLRFNAGSPVSFENITSTGGSVESKLEAAVKAAQVGLEAGVGLDVLMFTLDARYNLIGDMYTTKLDAFSLKNIPNNTFVISLGYKFL